MSAAELLMWVVYAPGTDGQPQYRARLWSVGPPAGIEPTGHVLTGDLESIRTVIVEGGFDARIERSETDEPHIVEVWL